VCVIKSYHSMILFSHFSLIITTSPYDGSTHIPLQFNSSTVQLLEQDNSSSIGLDHQCDPRPSCKVIERHWFNLAEKWSSHPFALLADIKCMWDGRSYVSNKLCQEFSVISCCNLSLVIHLLK
jgi:hypothetical protein